jgi:excisionase family DNA binding protein
MSARKAPALPPASLTAKDVAALEQVSDDTVQAWCSAGLLTAYKLPGGAWRITPGALEEFRRAGGAA